MREILRQPRSRQLPDFVDRALSFGEDPEDSPDQRQIKRVVIGALWFSIGPNSVTTAVMYLSGAAWAGTALAGVEGLVIVILFWLRKWPKAWPTIFHALIAGNIAVSVAMTILFGGIADSGTNFIWGYAGLLAAVVAFRDRRLFYWLSTFAVLTVVSEIAARSTEPRYEMADAAIATISNLIVVGGFTFGVLLYFIRQRDQLQEETDRLLRNVLPDEIANRLLVSGDRIADHFDEASILFADLVGFTPMSARMSPTETVDLLNEVFSAFDEMVEERGLEKIKTVGDEYMVAAGVPEPRGDHAHALADLAIAMRDFAASREIAGRSIQFRIGLNSGPVVAGIIGSKKFSYDLWGDSVNTASRLESHGEPGHIQISESTFHLIEGEFDCSSRGTIELKGKGAVPVWFLNGRTDRSG